MRQIIETSYRDTPDASSTSEMLTMARRDPPAVMTTLTVDGGKPTITLIVPGGLWTRNADGWVAVDAGELPAGWALNAYRELGDMSLVAPLAAQTAVDAGERVGSETINGTETSKITTPTEAMLELLMVDYAASGRATHDPAPPDSYLNSYAATFWIDPISSFIIQEQTVIEYTEERLHGQAIGTGPATFTTTRSFYDFNADLEIPIPQT